MRLHRLKRLIEPDHRVQLQSVMPGIRAVKANRVGLGTRFLHEAVIHLLSRSVDTLLLACTEIPIALANMSFPVPGIDTTDMLAHACVSWWRFVSKEC